MKNLELMGVRELDAVEMRNENGGGWMAWVLGAVVGAMCVVGDANQTQIDAAGYIAFKNA